MDAAPRETCWTMVRAAADGDRSARSLFARSYVRPIRSYLTHRWRGTPLISELDDAVQETFIESLRPGGVLERADPDRGDFRGLLHGLVRNIARRYEVNSSRSRAREDGAPAPLDNLPDDAEGLSRVFDRAWARSLIRQAVLRHREAADREAADRDGEEALRRFRVLRMRHDEDLPIREIAARLGEPDAASVHNDYRQARRAFTTHLRFVVARNLGVEGAAIDVECRRLIELLGD